MMRFLRHLLGRRHDKRPPLLVEAMAKQPPAQRVDSHRTVLAVGDLWRAASDAGVVKNEAPPVKTGGADAEKVPHRVAIKRDIFDSLVDGIVVGAHQHQQTAARRPAKEIVVEQPRLRKHILTLHHIWKIYGRGASATVALRDVNLGIRRGMITGIVGPSGSGKTTLLNILAGTDDPTMPPYGEDEEIGIHYSYMEDGIPETTWIDYGNGNFMDDYRRTQVGIVFQSPCLYSDLPVWKNVALSLVSQGCSFRQAREPSMNILKFVGMAEMAKRMPGGLSGGEAQRVAVARALVKEVPLIFADEPTGNLDRKNTTVIMDLLARCVSDKQCTVVLVTHNDAVVKHYCSRVFRFTDTGVVEKVTATEDD